MSSSTTTHRRCSIPGCSASPTTCSGSTRTTRLPPAARCGFRGRPVENHIALPIGETSGRLSGWILVDGRAADAVLVRAGERLTPVAPAVERDDAARLTRDISNRFAGFLGTVAIPADARALEIIAFDRARGRRAAHRLEITRTAAKPPLERSAAATRARIAKALRRK